MSTEWNINSDIYDIVGSVNDLKKRYIEDEDETTALMAEERSLIAKNLFASLYKDENGDILPNEQIIKNFNQITFFSYCHGATEISYICMECLKQMQKHGISKDVAEDALGQMFNVSYSPDNITYIPSLRIFSEEDKMRSFGATSEKISSEHMFNIMEQVYPKTPHNGVYKADDYTAVLITSHIIKPDKNVVGGKSVPSFGDEHDILLIDRNKTWEPVESRISSFGDKVSQVAGYTLARSIANSIQNQHSNVLIPKPSIDEVILATRSILAETQKKEFYGIIKNIKESHGETTYDIPDELISHEPN